MQPKWQFKGKPAPKIEIVARAGPRDLPPAQRRVRAAGKQVGGKAQYVKMKIAQLDAPRMKRIYHDAPLHSRRSVARIVVELDGKPADPAGALVITDASGTPRSSP